MVFIFFHANIFILKLLFFFMQKTEEVNEAGTSKGEGIIIKTTDSNFFDVLLEIYRDHARQLEVTPETLNYGVGFEGIYKKVTEEHSPEMEWKAWKTGKNFYRRGFRLLSAITRHNPETPDPWPVLSVRKARYTIKHLPENSSPLIIDPLDEGDETLTIPSGHLDMEKFGRAHLGVGQRLPYVTFAATSDKDLAIFSNWELTNLGPGLPYKGPEKEG